MKMKELAKQLGISHRMENCYKSKGIADKQPRISASMA